MRKLLIFFLLLLLVAAGAGAFFWFFEDMRPAIVNEWIQWVKGEGQGKPPGKDPGKASAEGPAKTPAEALERFKKAIMKRDYKTAATYCDKEYAEQMLKAAESAQKLGQAIDSLGDIKSLKVRIILHTLEPFPTNFTVADLKAEENTATAELRPEEGPKLDRTLSTWYVLYTRNHKNMINSLLPEIGWGKSVELVREGTTRKPEWKIKVGVTPRLTQTVEALMNNGTNYANALMKVSEELKTKPATKAEVDKQVEKALSESK
jgi:hypothetical protein